jgi:hypothetical protein
MNINVKQTILGAVVSNDDYSIGSFDVALGALMKSEFTAKGDLIGGTADDTVDNLAVGTDATILSALSTEATGLKYISQVQGTTFLLTNTDSVIHPAGTVVRLDTGADNSCKKTAFAGDPRAYAVALTDVNASVQGVYAQTGKLTVLVQGNVSRGQWLVPSGTAGLAMAYVDKSGADVIPTSGIGVALTSYGGGGSGSVVALVDCNPMIALGGTGVMNLSGTDLTFFGHITPSQAVHRGVHYCRSGTTMIILTLHINQSAFPTSITYGGNAMTPHVAVSASTGGVAIYYLDAPTPGNNEVIITFASPQVLGFQFTSLSNASGRRTPVSYSGSNVTAIPLSVTSAAGDLVITACSIPNGTNWVANLNSSFDYWYWGGIGSKGAILNATPGTTDAGWTGNTETSAFGVACAVFPL